LLTSDAAAIRSAMLGVGVQPSPAPPATETPVAPSSSPAPATTTPAPAPASNPPAPASNIDCSKLTCAALTFDDGPGPYTASILDTLDAAGVKATFCELGQSVRLYPDLVRRQQASGMVIGNHTHDHKQLNKLSAVQQRSELDRGAAAIAAAGVPAPTMFRPPYKSEDSLHFVSENPAGLPRTSVGFSVDRGFTEPC